MPLTLGDVIEATVPTADDEEDEEDEDDRDKSNESEIHSESPKKDVTMRSHSPSGGDESRESLGKTRDDVDDEIKNALKLSPVARTSERNFNVDEDEEDEFDDKARDAVHGLHFTQPLISSMPFDEDEASRNSFGLPALQATQLPGVSPLPMRSKQRTSFSPLPSPPQLNAISRKTAANSVDDDVSSEEEEDSGSEEDFSEYPDPQHLDEVSDKQIDRKDLSRLRWWSYLVVPDKEDRRTWKLPFRDGVGRLNRPLLSRARLYLTDESLCSDAGIVPSRAVLHVAKQSFERCWPGQPFKLVCAIEDREENDEAATKVAPPMQSTKSLLEETRALKSKLEKTTSSSDEPQQRPRRAIVEVESDVAPDLIMKLRERKRALAQANAARPVGGAVVIKRGGLLSAPATSRGEAKLRLVLAAKRKLAEVRSIKRQTDEEFERAHAAHITPVVEAVEAPLDESKAQHDEPEEDGDWSPSSSSSSGGSSSSSSSSEDDSSGESDEEGLGATAVIDDEEEFGIGTINAASVLQVVESSIAPLESSNTNTTGIRSHTPSSQPCEPSGVPSISSPSESIVGQESLVGQSASTSISAASSEARGNASMESLTASGNILGSTLLPEPKGHSQTSRNTKRHRSTDNEANSQESGSKEAEHEEDGSSHEYDDDKEEESTDDSDPDPDHDKKESPQTIDKDVKKPKKESNAQYRKMLEDEARMVKKKRKNKFFDDEAQESEDEEQVGVYSFTERVIGQEGGKSDDEEEADVRGLMPTEDDLKHIVDTNSDDEGDDTAAQNLFQKQLDDKDDQMLRRVQRDLENHTFLNRRRKLMASGLERALNDVDSDEEADEEMEMAQQKRFDDEMKRRMKEAQEKNASLEGNVRKGVVLGETVEEIEQEQEQTKRFLERARKMKRSGSILPSIPSASSSTQQTFSMSQQSTQPIAIARSTSILGSTIDMDEDSRMVFESISKRCASQSSQPIIIEGDSSQPELSFSQFSRESSLPPMFQHAKRPGFLKATSSQSSSMTTGFVYTKRVKVAEGSQHEEDENQNDESEQNTQQSVIKPTQHMRSRTIPQPVMSNNKRRVPLVPAVKLPSAKLLALTSMVEKPTNKPVRNVSG